jgi:hypothetical protein
VLLAEVRRLAAADASYAELWRRLRPIADRMGIARPSYGWVRRFAGLERRRARETRELWGDVAAGVASGLVKRPLFRVLEHMEERERGAIRGQPLDEAD